MFWNRREWVSEITVAVVFCDAQNRNADRYWNADDAELRRTLQSLACGKKKVLKKVPPGRDVEDDDVFKYNPDFEDPHAKVHINSIQAKVSVCVQPFTCTTSIF